MLNVELYDVKGQLGGMGRGGNLHDKHRRKRWNRDRHEGEGDGDLPCFEASGVTSCTSDPGCRQWGLQNTSLNVDHEITDE